MYLYSEHCRTCIAIGCPDDCDEKRIYLRDFVKVVRCKDCRYHFEMHDKMFCDSKDYIRKVSPDGFCEKGK